MIAPRLFELDAPLYQTSDEFGATSCTNLTLARSAATLTWITERIGTCSYSGAAYRHSHRIRCGTKGGIVTFRVRSPLHTPRLPKTFPLKRSQLGPNHVFVLMRKSSAGRCNRIIPDTQARTSPMNPAESSSCTTIRMCRDIIRD